MCKVHILRTLVKQRLNVAVEEIFELFERTIAEYEEELCRTKEEKARQAALLDAVLKPNVVLHKADVQQISVKIREDKQKDPAEPLHVKEEDKNGDHVQELEGEANINTFTWTDVIVKSEVDDGRSSQLRHCEMLSQHTTTQSDAVCREGSRADYISPLSREENMSDSSDTDHSETEFLENNTTSKTNMIHQTPHSQLKCPQCEQTFANKRLLKSHVASHLRAKPFACSVCQKRFSFKSNVKRHMRRHTGEKPFTCAVCARRFHDKDDMKRHMTIHTGVKPFLCPVCAKEFSRRSYLRGHMTTHTGEKPFPCTVCAKPFALATSLRRHVRKQHGGGDLSVAQVNT